MQQVTSLQKIERRSDRARQVRELLRFELLQRAYGGSLLPCEQELMLRYSCSRNALREALDLLRHEGLIARVPGAGTFAIVDKEIYQHDWLRALAEQLVDGTRRVTINVLEARLVPAPMAVAGKLAIQPGEEAVFFERRLYLDGTPLSLWSSYLPARTASGLLDGDLEEDFYKLIEEHLGLELGNAEIAIDAMRTDRSLASMLDCDPAAPVLHLTRLLRQANGEPLEFGFVHLRGERIQFVSVLERLTHRGER